MNTKPSYSVQPLDDRVLIEPLEGESVSPGGIHWVEKKDEHRGKVVAVGPGKLQNGQRHPVSLNAGDIVIYTPYAGKSITYNGMTLLIVHETDIIALERSL